MQPASYVARLICRTPHVVGTSLEIFSSSANARGAHRWISSAINLSPVTQSVPPKIEIEGLKMYHY